MTTTIALAGKGGTGKTTVAAMIIKYLIQKQNSPILAIDADPSANLNMVLGVDLDWTVGGIREDMLNKSRAQLPPAELPGEALLEVCLNMII